MKLQGAVAVVTGGGGTIGREIAAQLAAEGVNVARWDRSFDDDSGIVCDVGDEAATEAAFAESVANYGVPTILVNAAGVSGGKSPKAVHASEEEWPQVLSSSAAWQAAFHVNVLGIVNTSRAFARTLRAHQMAGAIVNVTSISGGPLNNGVLAAYSASKAAANKLTRIAAVEFGPLGIRVNAVAPGSMEIRMRSTGTDAAATPQGQSGGGGSVAETRESTLVEQRSGRASDIAQGVLGLLTMDFVTGEILTVDGGLMLARTANTSG